MRRLLEAFERTNRRYGLVRKNDRIVLGLSGGPDSTALLLLLLALRRKYSLTLCAAHLDHRLPSARSAGHAAFSRKLARKLGVPLYAKSVSVKKLARLRGQTVEEAGREQRYAFFSQVAKKTRSTKIATAHTLDDQAETVFMRAVRGAGLRGLCGIPAKRAEGKLEVIRPLIGSSKKEIVDFLEASGQPFFRDPSNARDLYTRNRVRNRLLPWIEKHMNPQIKQGLADLGEICAETQDLVDGLAESALRRCLRRRSPREVRLDARRLSALHPALCAEVIAKALGLLKKGRARFGSSHILAVRGLLASPGKRAEAHLPGPVTALREGAALRIFDSPSK